MKTNTPATTAAPDLRTALEKTVFALESVLHLSGSRLPAASIPELVKFAEYGRAALDNAPAAGPDLCEALRDCITESGALAERSHAFALKRLAAISEMARAALESARPDPVRDAAPQLLAACRALLKNSEWAVSAMPDIPANSEFRATMTDARTAIAQAEGTPRE